VNVPSQVDDLRGRGVVVTHLVPRLRLVVCLVIN
jgi:hypothetical protein